LSKGIIATVGGGPSFGSQAGETESTALWELKEEQDRMKGKKQAAARKLRRLLVKQGKDVPLV
jgi:hypothetical protein